MSVLFLGSLFTRARGSEKPGGCPSGRYWVEALSLAVRGRTSGRLAFPPVL